MNSLPSRDIESIIGFLLFITAIIVFYSFKKLWDDYQQSKLTTLEKC